MNGKADNEKGKRGRSPSFPFISLGTAVERLIAFEEYFKRHPAPADKVGLAWEMKADSSQALQTVAALKAFGLVEVQRPPDGSALIVVSDDGRTYLRAQQESIKAQVLRRAAVRPKLISSYWHKWGADRPPDPVCLDDLVLKGNFTEDGAGKFLKVYDQTIALAGLAETDKNEAEEPSSEGLDDGENDAKQEPPPPPPPPKPERRIMEGERELTTGLLSKGTSFRLIVSGKIGPKEIDRLIKKLEIDKDILAEPHDDDAEDDADGNG
jgi:hypothetical protein